MSGQLTGCAYMVDLELFSIESECYIEENFPALGVFFDWEGIFELLLEIVQGYTLRREAVKGTLGNMFTDAGYSSLATESGVNDLVDMLEKAIRVVTKENMHYSNHRITWDGYLTLMIYEVLY